MASFDVAIPNYQFGRFLRSCVTSVLRQDVSELRVLVIDNASTDESVAVARRLAAQDNRVKVVERSKNLGPHASFNEAIEWASADYFLILPSDDMLAPGALARAGEVMSRRPEVHLTYGRPLELGADMRVPELDDETGTGDWRIMSGRNYIELVCRTLRSHISPPTAVVRTATQKAVGFYKQSLPYTDDLEMWLRLALVGDVAATDAIQGINRRHSSSQSAGVQNAYAWDKHAEEALSVFFREEGRVLPDASRLLKRARRRVAERAYWGSWARRLRGESDLSRELRRSALTLCPDMALIPPVSYLMRDPAIVGNVFEN
jgi:glycosyltransferase involved in cell wall biosynthesis